MLDLLIYVLVYLLPFATLVLGKGGGGKGGGGGKSSGSTSHPAPIVYGSGSSRYCVDAITRHYVTCPKNTKLDKGAIIGIAVGCSVFGALIIGLLIWWFRSGQYHKYGKPRNLEGGTYQEVKTTDDADAQVVKPLAADYEPPTGGYVENDAKHSDATATLSPNRNLIEKDGVNKNDTETISASIAKS